MAEHMGAPRPTTLSEALRQRTGRLTSRLGALGVRLGISPDVVTVLGLLMVLVAAWLAARGQHLPAGVVLIAGAPLDALDGAIARAMQRKNRFGALLDSTLDRYADGFMFFGLAYYFAAQGQLREMTLAGVALIGAFAVSYVRARAEGLGLGTIRDGLFDRLVRTLIMIGLLLTGLVVPGLVILAAGNHLTALHRIWIVYQATRADGS